MFSSVWLGWKRFVKNAVHWLYWSGLMELSNGQVENFLYSLLVILIAFSEKFLARWAVELVEALIKEISAHVLLRAFFKNTTIQRCVYFFATGFSLGRGFENTLVDYFVIFSTARGVNYSFLRLIKTLRVRRTVFINLITGNWFAIN